MKLACVQSNVVFNDPAANTANAIAEFDRLKQQGVEFVVFPEAFLTGYCVDTPEKAAEIAISAESSYIQDLKAACERLDMMAVIGFAEKGDRLYNSAVLIEPGKSPRIYRKSHLPEL